MMHEISQEERIKKQEQYIYWNLKDIQDYLGCGRNKASQVRQIAINEFHGLCFYDKRKLKKQAVLQAIEFLEERG